MYSLLIGVCLLGFISAGPVTYTEIFGIPAGGSVNSVEINGCDLTSCIVKKGVPVTLKATFTSGGTHNTLFGRVSSTILGVNVILPLEENNACKLGANCPVYPGDVNTVTETTTIPTSYPSITVTARFQLTDENSLLATGFTTVITLVD